MSEIEYGRGVDTNLRIYKRKSQIGLLTENILEGWAFLPDDDPIRYYSADDLEAIAAKMRELQEKEKGT